MIVTCHTIDEFLENLLLEGKEKVLQQVVYVSRVFKPVDDDSRSVVTDVFLQASAVINIDDEGQYLLRAGVSCGVDYHDATSDFAGSDKASELRDRIKTECDRLGMSVRPGVVDM